MQSRLAGCISFDTWEKKTSVGVANICFCIHSNICVRKPSLCQTFNGQARPGSASIRSVCHLSVSPFSLRQWLPLRQQSDGEWHTFSSALLFFKSASDPTLDNILLLFFPLCLFTTPSLNDYTQGQSELRMANRIPIPSWGLFNQSSGYRTTNLLH